MPRRDAALMNLTPLRKLRSKIGMHTVCELHSFRRAAERAGMSEQEVSDLADLLASDPTAGVEIPDTGGCRKVRVAGRGKGKSGGYRTITFYTGDKMPVFLVTGDCVLEGPAFRSVTG